jgi:hypothetical protein
MNASGHCFCGAVGFSLEWPSKWVAHCHCTMCQRAHGAAYVTWVGMAEDRVHIEDPQHQLRWFASSPGAERGFCVRCGSSLFFRSSRWAGELHVARANLDGDTDKPPVVHAFWDTHVDWASIDADDGLMRQNESEL